MQTMKAAAFERRRALPAGSSAAVLALGGDVRPERLASLAALRARERGPGARSARVST